LVVPLLPSTLLSPVRPPPRPTLFPYTTLSDLRPHLPYRIVAAGTGAHGVVALAQPLEEARHGLQRDAHAPVHVHGAGDERGGGRSEEHTSELQSRENLVCRLLLEKKKQTPDSA